MSSVKDNLLGMYRVNTRNQKVKDTSVCYGGWKEGVGTPD